jgi:hypothetical protein
VSSAFWEHVRRWLRRERAASRMSEGDALHLAREHARAAGYDASDLQMITRQMRDGRVVWQVSRPVIGSNLVIEIDDERGEVITCVRVSGR